VHEAIGHRSWRMRIAVLITVALVASVYPPLLAHAVTGNPALVLSDNSATSTGVTYTYGPYNLGGNQSCTGVVVTFPAGTAFVNPTCSPAGTVTVVGQTATIVFTTPIPKNAVLTFSISGVTNPSAGSYTNAVTFNIVDHKGARSTETVTSPAYSIIDRILTVTLSSSSLYFDLTPEVVSPDQYVTLNVTSSHAYTITRTVAGDSGLMGLTVSGAATGAQTAGTAALTDTYSASVPWTTPGAATYTATVTYTIVQN